MDPNDVGMGETLGFARLPLQDLQRIISLEDIDIQRLHGDVGMPVLCLLPAQVASLEHGAHATRADLGLNDEPARQYIARSKRFPWSRRHLVCSVTGTDLRLPTERIHLRIKPAAGFRIPDPARLRSPVTDQDCTIDLRALDHDAIDLRQEFVLAQSSRKKGVDRRYSVHMG